MASRRLSSSLIMILVGVVLVGSSSSYADDDFSPKKPNQTTTQEAEQAAKFVAEATCKGVEQRALFALTLEQRLRRDVNEKADAPVTSMTTPRLAACFRAELASEMQLGADEVVTEILRTAGQIVVDRAVSNAWVLLKDRLEDAAGCDETPSTYKHVCGVLADVRLQDLVASPRVLLDAALEDLFDKIKDELSKLDVGCYSISSGSADAIQICPGELIVGAVDAWRLGGRDGAMQYLRAEIGSLTARVSTAIDQSCNTDLCRALRAAGYCIAVNAKANKDSIRCALVLGAAGIALPREARELLTALERVIFDADRSAVVKLVTSFVRDRLGTLAVCKDTNGSPRPACSDLVNAFEALFIGVAEEDWNRVARGAVGALSAAAILGNGDDPKGGKLFKLMAAVGQYSATYVDSKVDAETAAATRRKVIEALIDATTDRSERESGVVVSIGGAFGAGYGWRKGVVSDGKDLSAAPTPLHLGFGVGFDSYHGDSCLGAHGMISILDISQYVAFEDKDFQVADPDIKASIAIGATVGLRFAMRQTPMFAGVNFTYSPFVNVTDESMTTTRGSYQWLGLVAAYVPFFDFN